MLITHDLGVIAQMAQHVIVMYAGRIVESAPVDDLFDSPKHPYTVGLLKSIPSLDEEKEVLNVIEGSVPSPFNLPEGCLFAPRCDKAMEICRKKKPGDYKVNDSIVNCFLYDSEVE